MKTIKILFTIAFVLMFVNTKLNAQSSWHLADDKKSEVMPISYGPAAIDAGKAAYAKFNCKSCHGDLGANNGLPLVPKPTDLGLAAFHKANSDGEIFYKITDGKGAMPAFKAQIPETDRWNLVCFIRSFDKEYKGAGPAVVRDNFKGKITGITLNYDTATRMLSATLSANDSTGVNAIPAKVGVEILIKRQFGYLKLSDSPIKTDNQGKANIELPLDLPADSAGKIIVKVQLPEGSVNGNISLEQEINVYKPTTWVNPLSKRELWGTRANTPLWLLFAYVGITLAVWLGIGWVVIQLLRIYSLRER